MAAADEQLRPVEPVIPPCCIPPEEWAQCHRDAGHHPYSAPTEENPERWDSDCGHIWRILTLEHIRASASLCKFEKMLDDEIAEENRQRWSTGE